MDIGFVPKMMNNLPGVQNAQLAQPKWGAESEGRGAKDQYKQEQHQSQPISTNNHSLPDFVRVCLISRYE